MAASASASTSASASASTSASNGRLRHLKLLNALQNDLYRSHRRLRRLRCSVPIFSMAASTSTAADSTNNIRYDVFISHRGPDVKKTFASHLYRRLISHGLQVFLDYQELKEGEDLAWQIKGAIRTASIHVAIFSPTYADSNWCLDELLFMLESRAPIIPVFYHVEPADLRWTQGDRVYARSLRNLENKKTADDSQPRYNSKTIENWRSALSRAADISGLDLKAFDGDEGALLDKVVEVVFRKGVKTQLNVARYPTGLDEKVEDFKKEVLLQQHSGRVKLVGITGSGGVGKTTLAKELFNRKSSKYCKSYFLFDIRENAKNSLHSLQSKLLKGLLQLDMDIHNKDQGIEELKKHLSNSQVLLVLDDVDKVDQVEALLPVDVLDHDSLILITSRDKDILTRSGVQESSIYKLTGLNPERSTELFCSHAFCRPHPPSGFECMVNRFLKACDGLPLSLKVFGGLLHGNTDKSCWEDELERLEQILPDEIQSRLQISYDALSGDEKQMFLDIACFFIGEDRDTVIRVWDGSGWNGRRGFRSLMNKCLVELDINEYNYRDVKIENCIRMHDHLRDLGRALANAKGSGLPCRLWRGKRYMDDFLQQSYETTKVRGIRYYDEDWYASSEEDDDDERAFFSPYKMKNLQLLDTEIEEDLLKCLLEGVDSPELLWFRWLNSRCSSLPPCIPMKKLRVLEVDGDDMETLWPEELQAPLQLRELRIRASRFKIPKSIGQLKLLERMVVTSLYSWSGIIVEIPKEFCHLRSLKHLTLERAKMSSLPDSFGNLSTLEHIDLSHSDLETLPDSFGNLSMLEHINLSGSTHLERLPESFGNLSMLEHIDLSGSTHLERLPESFGNLIKLIYLDLKDCYNLTHSSGPFGKISTLEYIDLTGCHKIEVLPFQNLHQGTLRKLYVDGCSELEELPGLEHLSSLEELWANKCVKLKSIQGLAQLTQLRKLYVDGCSELEELPGLEHLMSLEELSAAETVKLKSLQGLAQLTQLRNLDVYGCSELEELPGLEHLRSLEELSAEKCVKLKSLRCSAQLLPFQILHQGTLRRLYVDGCSELEELPGLEHLSSLEELWAKKCVKLKSIRFSAQVTQLRKLYVDGCSELEELPGLEHLMSLEELRASECVKLKSIRFSAQVTQLRNLDVYGCSELEELPGFEHLRSLEKLSAEKCVKLKSLRCSAQLLQLRELYVYGCSELEEIPGLEQVMSLEKLWAFKCVKLRSIRCSAQLSQLRELYVHGCSKLEELLGLEHLMSLEKLSADESVKLKSIQGLAQLTKLRTPRVTGLPMGVNGQFYLFF